MTHEGLEIDGVSMEVALKKEPKVRISYDEMEAYLLLPQPFGDEVHEVEDVMAKIAAAGVKIGLNHEKVTAMVEEKYYDRECLIAEGIRAIEGVDGYFDFKFDVDFNKKPSHRPDGTVDYWSIHAIEMVEEGQVIAVYHEPVDGANGMNVKGKLIMAKRGRPLPPLTGKGFDRSEDNMTYTANMTGKIEMQNNRILISQVHEIHGDVGLTTGNIDFRGDVIIHGNVPTGAVIKATGSVTIDGTVEGCLIDANKDVIIRGGMLGQGRGMIKTRGNLHAKFLEYATVKAEGAVETDSAISCDITSNDKVYLRGKHASMVGGIIHAARGVEAFNFGNEYGLKTEIYAGVNWEVKRELSYHENCINEAQDVLNKINIGLKQLEEAAREQGLDLSKDPRKASLLRTRIVKQADLATHTQALNNMSKIVDAAHGASVKVLHNVYSGVTIGVNDAILQIQDQQESVSFFERDGRIVMFSMRDELVG